MADLTLSKNNLPFLLGGNGSLTVSVPQIDLTQKLDESTTSLLSVNFSATGGKSFTVGTPGSVKLAIGASANAQLTPLWASSTGGMSALQPYDVSGITLENFFIPPPQNADKMLLFFNCGAKFDASVGAKFQYSTLSASVTLGAGADASYALLGSCDKNKPAAAAIIDFFKDLKLPENIDGPMPPGQMIAFTYGGYLSLGASIGVGYQIAGGKSFDIGNLSLNEKYNFSLAAKVAVGAKVAGRYNITVYSLPEGWARVVVHKAKQSDITIAADVGVNAQFTGTGLPDSSQDFISAVLGLKAKNWINLFNAAIKWTDFKTLEQNLDDLAKSYIEQYIGKGFTALQNNPELAALMTKFQQVVNSYNNVGNDAITLFDKYFNIATNAVNQELNDALNAIKSVTTWDGLKARLNNEVGNVLWEVVNQLTIGDPLGWVLGLVKIDGQPVTLATLQAKVQQVEDLIDNKAHEEIRKVIALAKSQFPLDKFLTQLNGISFQKLQSLADAKAVGFAERVIGQTVKGLSDTDLAKAATKLNTALNKIQDFTNTAYGKFKEVLNQTIQFQLQAGYSRTAIDEALVDIELNLNTPKGVSLMSAAGRGDFSEVLANFDPTIVRLNGGTLTNSLTKQTTISVGIKGWHLNWNYQSISTLIVDAVQRISTDNLGNLVIDTTFDLKNSLQKTRNGERINTNLILSFIGQSKGKVNFDKDTQRYLVDSVTDITARYDLGFSDPDTSQKELAQYLSFADDFGLAASETAAMQQLQPLLATDANGRFGNVTVNYDVRFTPDGLKSLFGAAFSTVDSAFLQRTARYIVLMNSLSQLALAPRAWCYWSKQPFDTWTAIDNSFDKVSQRTFDIDPSPIASVTAPSSITLKSTELTQLAMLYTIERSLIRGMVGLSNLVRSSQSFSPVEFENQLADFGEALKDYDSWAIGQNATFALLDRMIQRAGGKRNSSLTLTATVNGQTTNKMLIA